MEKTVKKILCCEIHQETLDIYRVLMVNLKKFHTAVNGKSSVFLPAENSGHRLKARMDLDA